MKTRRAEFRVPRSRIFETHLALRDDIYAALDEVLFGSMKSGFEARESFEIAFADAVQHRHCVAVHSGAMGLFLALRACGVGAGDEVITVANSDISTTAAVRHCGAVPVLCDVQESDYTINPDLIEGLITPRTRAILPVDLHGHPADMARINDIAQRHNLRIVEDAALAAGAQDHGKPLGSFADVTIYSFAPLKPLGSVSNGAAVVTNDDAIYEQLQLLTHYGHAPETLASGHQHYIDEGYNAPLDALQAALLRVKLPYLSEWTQKRRSLVLRYELGLARTHATLPRFRSESEPTFRSYAVRVPNRQAIYEQMRDAGVEVVLHYTPPVHQQPVYHQGLPGSRALPITERLAEEIICLPVSPDLTESDIDYVIAVLSSLLEESKS